MTWLLCQGLKTEKDATSAFFWRRLADFGADWRRLLRPRSSSQQPANSLRLQAVSFVSLGSACEGVDVYPLGVSGSGVGSFMYLFLYIFLYILYYIYIIIYKTPRTRPLDTEGGAMIDSGSHRCPKPADRG